MRYLIVLLFSLFLGMSTLDAAAQDAQDAHSDSVTFSWETAQNITKKIKKLQEKVKIQEEEIEVRDEEIGLQKLEIFKLDSIIYNYKFIARQNSLIINYKDIQIGLLNENLKLWEKKAHRPWYKSHTFGIIKGILFVSTSAWVFSQIQQ